MIVYLIRHAKIITPEKIVQGINDPIIVNRHTIRLANETRRLVPNPEKIYRSELVRAKQTVDLIYPDRNDVVVDSDLNEYVRPSRFIGRPKSELRSFWDENILNRYNVSWSPEDGESFGECANRALRFYTKLLVDKKDGVKNVSVIGHGTLFRHLMCALTNVPEWQENPHIIIDLLRKFSWNNLEVKQIDI